MNAMKMSLVLVLGFAAPHVSASFVPVTANVVEATLNSSEGPTYLDGYVQLNKTVGTISLVLQPKMPKCPSGRICTQAMPDAAEYYFTNIEQSVDACNAVSYTAEQTVGNSIKVTVVDNTQYNYGECPTLAPLADTVVLVEQIISNATGEVRVEEILSGDSLTTIQF